MLTFRPAAAHPGLSRNVDAAVRPGLSRSAGAAVRPGLNWNAAARPGCLEAI